MFIIISCIVFSVFWLNFLRFFYSIKRVIVENQEQRTQSRKLVVFSTSFFNLYEKVQWFNQTVLQVIKQNSDASDVYIGDCSKIDVSDISRETNQKVEVINIDDQLISMCSNMELTNIKMFSWFFDRFHSEKRFQKRNQYHILHFKQPAPKTIHQCIQQKIDATNKSEFIMCNSKTVQQNINTILHHFTTNHMQKQWKTKYEHIYTQHEEAEITTKNPLQIHLWSFDFETIIRNLDSHKWVNRVLETRDPKTKIDIKIPIQVSLMHPFYAVSNHLKLSSNIQAVPKIYTKASNSKELIDGKTSYAYYISNLKIN